MSQVIEAMPGSVVPLAMFYCLFIILAKCNPASQTIYNDELLRSAARIPDSEWPFATLATANKQDP